MNILSDFNHFTHVQIRFNDIDILGHVNNAVQQHYFDFARLKYFEEVLNTTIDWKDKSLVIASISTDFENPVFLEESIIVLTRTDKIGNKSLQMTQKIVTADFSEIKTSGTSVMVGYSRSENTPIIIPENWKAAIRRFESIPVLTSI
jgi:acyl-CoA thioester hydrolase